jgi:hypothetical protein
MAREVPLRAAGPGGSVAPGPSASALFAAAIASPREARHFVCDVLREWGFGRDARDGAALVTTELAAIPRVSSCTGAEGSGWLPPSLMIGGST